MIKIKTHEFRPPEAGEEPGMPYYRVTGTVDEKEFSVDIHCGVDDWECGFDNATGPATDDATQDEIFEALCEVESWIESHETQIREYYENN
jgi:hypothetical protein